ncbi:hexose transporter [Artomyces pyxidatus]|uniref:Hexose transporter n=1 Tax=Artomyces pyxidatus TaxID=48021 RepID=A0ACB8SKT3_9AGAM|nr:hexose transporter [Artomyces pyxidatus]
MEAAAEIDQKNTGEAFYLQLIDTSKPWYKNRRLVTLNLWILLLLITSTANGYDGSMMNGLQILDQWEDAFNHPTGSKLGLLGAIQNIGSLGATPFVPYFADILGRRRTVIFGAAVMVAGTIVQTASQSVSMFIGARFLCEFKPLHCISASRLISLHFEVIFPAEVMYSTQRAPVASVYNALWPGGAFIASWVTFGSFHIKTSWAWRLPSACQAIPSVLQIIFLYWGPESPRWLVSKGREEEALETLAYYHASGNRDDPLVQFEYAEIRAALAEEKIQDQAGWLDLFRTSGMRKRMRIIIAIAFFSQWSGNGLVYLTAHYCPDLNQVFDTIGITNKVEQLLINAFLNMWSLILAVLGGLYCDRLGRRTLFLTSTAGMLLFFCLQTIGSSQYALHGNKSAGNAVVAFIFLYSAAYAIAYSPLIVSYTLEILPFNLRAKGMTTFQIAVTASLIFNQYVNPLALKAIHWKYYIVYCVWDAFELVFIYFFMVEVSPTYLRVLRTMSDATKQTRNRTLEETAVLFDGDTKLLGLTRRAAAEAGMEGADIRESEKISDEKEAIDMVETVNA